MHLASVCERAGRPYLWPKQLHDGDSSIYIHVHDGFESLWRHHAHNQVVAFCLYEVEVRGRREATSEGVRHGSRLVGRHNVVGAHGRLAWSMCLERLPLFVMVAFFFFFRSRRVEVH